MRWASARERFLLMQIAEEQRNQVFNPTGAPLSGEPASGDEPPPREEEASNPFGEEGVSSTTGKEAPNPGGSCSLRQ